MTESIREDQKKDGIQEVDGADGDVEDVGLLVHEWPQYADSNQKSSLDDEQSNSLSDRGFLGKCNEHSLEQNVSKHCHNEPIGGSLVLDVEEAPLVEAFGIGVEDVCWVLMHIDRLLSERYHFVRSPAQSCGHRDEDYQSKDDFGS